MHQKCFCHKEPYLGLSGLFIHIPWIGLCFLRPALIWQSRCDGCPCSNGIRETGHMRVVPTNNRRMTILAVKNSQHIYVLCVVSYAEWYVTGCGSLHWVESGWAIGKCDPHVLVEGVQSQISKSLVTNPQLVSWKPGWLPESIGSRKFFQNVFSARLFEVDPCGDFQSG